MDKSECAAAELRICAVFLLLAVTQWLQIELDFDDVLSVCARF